MNILFLIDSLGSGGAQRQMVTIAILLKKRGYNVTFLTYYDYNFFKEELECNNIEIIRVNASNYLERIIKIRRIIRSKRYEIVLSFLDTPNFLNNLAAIGGKSWKVITSERSAKIENFYSPKGKIFNFFQRFSDCIICNSDNAKNIWLKHYPSYEHKLLTINNTVTLPEISTTYIFKKNNKFNIVVAASYQHIKNPLNLAKALNKLTNEQRQQLEINWYGRKEVSIGNTKAFDEVKEYVLINNLEGVMKLNSETKDIANKMNEADFIGLFSDYEGMPNAICEGMLLKKPILMSRVSDYNTLVKDKNGLLCEANDIDTIKVLLENILLLSKEQIIEMGKHSKLIADNLFSEDKVISKWIKILKGK